MNAQAAFSADGRVLALSDPSGVLLWDLWLGKELRRLGGLGADVTGLAFSPDGRRLLTGLSDSTALVWDVPAVRGGARPAVPDAAAAARAWADLGGDARKGLAARGALARSPASAVPLLRGRLRPAPVPDAARLRRLLAELDSDQFAAREEARKQLEAVGEPAKGALQRALADKPSLEMRRRLRSLLRKLSGPVTRPDALRALRGLAVLEDVGTAEARRVLEALAKGEPEARLTRGARASLERLARRTGAGP
jgi:hypothetical protein